MTYGSNYALLVNGVRDLAMVPNVIATNTLTALLLAAQFGSFSFALGRDAAAESAAGRAAAVSNGKDSGEATSLLRA